MRTERRYYVLVELPAHRGSQFAPEFRMTIVACASRREREEYVTQDPEARVSILRTYGEERRAVTRDEARAAASEMWPGGGPEMLRQVAISSRFELGLP